LFFFIEPADDGVEIALNIVIYCARVRRMFFFLSFIFSKKKINILKAIKTSRVIGRDLFP